MARILGLAALVLAVGVTCFVSGPVTGARPVPRVTREAGDKFSAWSEDAAKPEVENKANWGLRATAAATLALVLALLPMDAAEAARSGGRMGGGRMGGSSRGFAARSPPRAQAPRSAATARGSSGGSVSIGIGAPMISPFGFSPFSPFGYGFGFGMPVPLGPMGPSASDQMLQNQQVQDERKLDEQKQEIAALKKELDDLKMKSK